MKVAFLLTSLQLIYVLVSGQEGRGIGSLRASPYSKQLNFTEVEWEVPTFDYQRYELLEEQHPITITTHDEQQHRNLTASCGDNTCATYESSTTCPSDCSNLKLLAGNVGGRSAKGVMFYVEAKRDVKISGFDIYSNTVTSSSDHVQVYTRQGKYTNHALSNNGWNLIFNNQNTKLKGPNVQTFINTNPVTVRANTIQSFFIWTSTNKIRYRIGKSPPTSEGNAYLSDTNLVVHEGIAKHSKFSGNYNQQTVEAACVFRGNIRYQGINLNEFTTTSKSKDPLVKNGFQKQERTICSNANQRRLSIEIVTDDYGHETSWILKKSGTNTITHAGPTTNYESTTSYGGTICVDVGYWEFTINDLYKDGLTAGSNGRYKIDVETENGSMRMAALGSDFGASKIHVIDVGMQEPTMTARDRQYLASHNKRRREWHTRYDKEYIPLKWSKGLKDSSMEWAEQILDECLTGPPRHAPNNAWGENISRNKGSQTTFGRLYDADLVVSRFVEHEVGLPWARNGHLTNALWRSTKYVGCAEAKRDYQIANGATHTCRTIVCRYAKPGNCSMGKYKDLKTNVVDWETPMMADDSPCGPECPPEDVCYE